MTPFFDYETLINILFGLFLLSLSLFVSLFIALVLFVIYYRVKWRRKRSEGRQKIVGFFHPYTDGGGGGERVLWSALYSLSKKYSSIKFVVYTGDVSKAPDQILTRAQKRFNLRLSNSCNSLEFVYLHSRKWIEASSYPIFTLLCQSLGSIFLVIEAFNKVVPDIFLDTMGYSFTLPVAKYVAKARVGAYVHYPTISTDMLTKVKERTFDFNNRRFISQNSFATFIKLKYYKLFAYLYGLCGKCSDVTCVNSSWTEGHIESLWKPEFGVLSRVYPPCDVSNYVSLNEGRQKGKDTVKRILSLGQFRPEKDHVTQIKTMFELRQILPEKQWETIKLVIIGGCRNDEDKRRVEDLKDLTQHLAVDNNVEFKVNVSFEELVEEMKGASIGIHTMKNEHFGIAVVEMLAAGLITLAHRSGGPLMDIIIEEESSRNGFLAAGEKEYAQIIQEILSLSQEEMLAIRSRAVSSVSRFSDEEFEKSWLRAVNPLFL